MRLPFHHYPGSSRLGYFNSKCLPYRDPAKSNIPFHTECFLLFSCVPVLHPFGLSLISHILIHAIPASVHHAGWRVALTHFRFPQLDYQRPPSSPPLTPHLCLTSDPVITISTVTRL